MSNPPAIPPDDTPRIDEAIAEYLSASDSGSNFDIESWLARYADCRDELERFLENERAALGEFLALGSEAEADLEATTEFSKSSSRSTRHAEIQPIDGEVPETIGGYRISRLLGVGGMGRVYEAIDSAGHPVAIKLLTRRYARSPETLKRFKQEGAIASAINHPRCVFVKAADEDAGQPYIVMELMSGQNLRDLVLHSGKLSVREAAAKVMDLLEGLQEAHLHGMIHRDIKPANCYLEANGRVKLGDFGLARSIVDTAELTQTGSFVGTPLYASPEQVRGEKLDERTDIYSVCATLYYLLTGQAPFAHSTPTQVIAKIVSENPIPPRKLNPVIPLGLENVVLKGLQRDRSLRYQTVEDLREAILPYVTGKQLVARLGKRLAAYGIDFLVYSLYGVLYALIWNPRDTLPEIPSIATYASLIGPIWLYNFLMEWRWNATLGKMIMRLRLVQSHSSHRPSAWRVAWRASCYTLLSGLLTDMFLYATMSPSNVARWSLWQSAGYTLTYILNSLPLLFTSGRLLLHDVLSGTAVIDLPERKATETWASMRHWQPSLFSAEAWPHSFGGYQVRGLILREGDVALLGAEDRALRREIWLLVRPKESTPLSASRQSCDRTTRPRWLMGAVEGIYRWDAFLACDGAPLSKCFSASNRADWQKTGRVLAQILDEVDRGAADRTSVNLQHLDQVWIDKRGRVCLMDWPIGAPPDSGSLKLDSRQPVLETVGLLRESARQMLCGISYQPAEPRRPIVAIVPLTARQLLNRLDGTSQSFPNDQELAAELNKSLQSPSETTFVHRLGTLGLAAITLAATIFITLSLCRLGNQVAISRIVDQLLYNQATKAVLNDENLREQLLTECPDLREQLTDEKLEDVLKLYQPELIRAYRQRFETFGSVHRTFAGVNGMLADIEMALQGVRVKIVTRIPLRIEVTDWRQTWSQIRQPITSREIAKHIILAPRSDLPGLADRSPLSLMIVVLLAPAVTMLWGGLMRGGIPMLALGLRLVKTNGQAAPGWMHMLRSVLIWAPILTLLSLLVHLDTYYPNQGNWIFILTQILCFSPILYSVVALASPRGGPQDWILGTQVVPK